jgi:hypothetical protein
MSLLLLLHVFALCAIYRWILRAQLSLLSQSDNNNELDTAHCDTTHSEDTRNAPLYTVHIALVTATALMVSKCDWSLYSGKRTNAFTSSITKATVSKREQYRQLRPLSSLLSMVLDCPMQPLQYIDKQLAKRTVRILHALQDNSSGAIDIPSTGIQMNDSKQSEIASLFALL